MSLSVDQMRGQAMDEQRLLVLTWQLFKKDAAPLVLGLLLIVLLYFPAEIVFGQPGISLMHHGHRMLGLVVGGGIPTLCVMPIFGGLIGIVIRRVRQQQRGRVREVFDAYRQFIGLFLASLAVIVCLVVLPDVFRHYVPNPMRQISPLVSLVGLPIAYLFPAIVDERLRIASAVRRSMSLVRGHEFWRTLVALVAPIVASYVLQMPFLLPHAAVTTLLQVVSAAAEVLLLLPLAAVYLTCMYFRARGEEQLLDRAARVPTTLLQTR